MGEQKVSILEKRLAECVGLWLAEGSTRSRYEITFTNNCWELIDLFYKTIKRLFKGNLRIYVYSKEGKKIKIPYKKVTVKFYVHKRATKPYFILRLASVQGVKEWKTIVGKTLRNKKLTPFLLRGFFAGEGNIKESSHNSRILRISQGVQKKFIDDLLNKLKLKFSFDPKKRNYIIRKKSNWDIFAKLKLADLHPDKKRKFWEIYNKFKEEHYEHYYLITRILPILSKPHKTKELAEKFNRSPARVLDVLMDLKKQKKIRNFRVKSYNYWTKNSNLTIISKLKKDYLLFLNKPKQTSEFAKHFKVCWKSSFRRLKELEKLNLTRRMKNGTWIKLQTKKKILVLQ